MRGSKSPLESYIEVLGNNFVFCIKKNITTNLNIGPHGCGNVLGRNVHICRRLIWTFILLFGLLYTFNVISINARKYFQFPSSLKPVLSNASNSTNSSIHYPSIVICHNSMHSDQLSKKM